jgi:RNA polymerase sigma-70 factor, ECF subfamily
MALDATVRSVAENEDKDLVERLRAADGRAMEPLMRRHNRLLFRTARAILADDAEAEDVVQDAYIRAYRSISLFRWESKLSTWLVRIVVNEALMRRRKKTRAAEVVPLGPTSNGGELGAGPISAPVENSSGPERDALRAEVRRLVERHIDALSESYRTVFVLRALEEMSVEETAVALSIPEATVRTRYFRARSLLRESLAQEADIALDGAFEFAGERCDRIVMTVLTQLDGCG